MHKPLLCAAVPLALLLGWMTPEAAAQSGAKEVLKEGLKHFAWTPVDYVVGKLLDRVLVQLGVEPDIDKIQKQLRELETNHKGLKAEVREEIRKLSRRISKSATRTELKALASEFKNNIREIHRRLDGAEERLEELIVKDEDRDHGTKNRENPSYFVGRGESLLASKEPFRALASARIASRLIPDKPEPYLLQGKVYAQMGATDLAFACYDQAIKVAPRHARSYRTRADAHLAGSNFYGAVRDYGDAVLYDPKDGWSWGHRAQARIALRSFSEAADDCSQALKLDPQDTFARLQRGRAYLLGGSPVKAIADFDVVLRAQPDDPEGYHGRGAAHLKNGALDKALADLQQALKLAPGHALAHGHLTQLWNLKGEHSKAVQTGRRAIQLDPKSWQARFEYALALQRTSKTVAAAQQYQVAARLNWRNEENGRVRAFANCGLIYFHKGDHTNAIRCLSSALAVKPDQTTSDGTPLLTFRARAYQAQGQYAKTIEDASAALRLNPRDGHALFARAYARSEQKQQYGAIDDYTQVIRLTPNDSAAYNNRGICYHSLGNNSRAAEDFSAAIRLKPTHEFAYFNRGVAYRALGKTSTAISDFVQALKSPNSGMREGAIANLVELSPGNAELFKALPRPASAYGTYSGLRKRLYVPGDTSSYGSYKDSGHWTTSSYRGHKNLPSGYWVYAAPYWYIWSSKR